MNRNNSILLSMLILAVSISAFAMSKKPTQSTTTSSTQVARPTEPALPTIPKDPSAATLRVLRATCWKDMMPSTDPGEKPMRMSLNLRVVGPGSYRAPRILVERANVFAKVDDGTVKRPIVHVTESDSTVLEQTYVLPPTPYASGFLRFHWCQPNTGKWISDSIKIETVY